VFIISVVTSGKCDWRN